MSGGCETMVHGVRAMLDLHPKWVILQVDVWNPFNLIFRTTIFHSYVGLAIGVLLLACLNTLSFRLSSTHSFTTFHVHLNMPQPIQCQGGHTIDDLGIHLLHCPCGSECIAAHDMFQNIVATIALKSGAHIQREVFHLFPNTHENKWILSSPKIIFVPWQMLSLSIRLIQIWCNVLWQWQLM